MAIEFNAVVPKPNLSANAVTTEITTSVQPDTGITTGVTTASITTATKIGNTITSVSQPTFIATAAASGPSEATAILFVRGLDQVTISDPAAITIRKPFIENVALLDSFFVSVIYNRSVLETVGVVSSVVYSEFLKVLNNNTNVIDTIMSIDVVKNLDNIASAFEIAKFVATKSVFNTISISDIDSIITVTNYLRSFEDLVDATDDYYGAANIDDDQYGTFTKVTIDGIQNYELISKSVVIDLLESVLNTSQNYNNFGKVLFDLTNFAEYNEYNVGKGAEDLALSVDTSKVYLEIIKSDTYVVADLFSKIVDYVRVFEDTAYIQEVFVKFAYLNKQETISLAGDVFNILVNYNRDFDETVNISETTYYNANTYFTEINSILDTNSTNISKITTDSNIISDTSSNLVNYLRIFEDLIDATDDYYGAANIDDDQYGTFTKVTIDIALQLDVTAFNVYANLNGINTSIIDSQAYNTGKILINQFTNSETNTKTFGAEKLDTLGLDETRSFNVNSRFNNSLANNDLFSTLLEYYRSFTEISYIRQDLAFFNTSLVKQNNINISDLFTRVVDYRPEVLNTLISTEYLVSVVDKNLLDIGAATETSAILTDKYLLNSFGISDVSSNQVSYLRSFEDLVDATDDYYGAATVGDDEYASFNKVTVDNILYIDTAVFDTAKVLSDSGSNLDILVVNINKPLSTQFNSTEINTKTIDSLKVDILVINQFKYLGISSVVNNTITNTDLLAALLEYYRNFADANVVQDLTTISTSIVKQHGIINSDVFTRTVDYQRQLVDAGIFSEYTVFVVNKNLLDIGRVTETSAILNDKYLLNSFGISDTANAQVSYLRSFEDLVDATDDYYGAATVGDDEYASFNKVTVDSILQQDTTRFDVAKILTAISTNSIIDTSTYNTGKFLNTQFNSAENNTKLIYSTKLETTNTAEVKYVNISSVLSNIVTNSDLFSRFLQYSRNLTETNNTEDLRIFNTNIIKQHFVSISDTSSSQVNYLRSFEDLVDATDDYYGAATVGDDEYASFSKVTVDSILQQDITRFNVAKILTDNNTVTETSANTTGKFLNTQFNSAENNTKLVYSTKLETTNIAEVKYVNINSILNNTVTSTDLANTLLQYLRSFTETNTIEDLNIFDTSIFKQHSASISDLFVKTIDYLRSFEDLVDATDDYYGAATIGDDEYASFSKVIADNILQLDVTRFDVANILLDVSNNIDSLAASTNKFLTVQFNSSDSNTKLANNLKLEILITSELNYFNISSVLDNTVDVTETKAIATDKYLSNIFSSSDIATTQVDYLRSFANLIYSADSINYFDISQVLVSTTTIIETKAITAAKYFSNTFSISDVSSNQVNYLRSFEDLLDATDDYYGAATVGDDEYASFSKVTVDSILQQDVTNFNTASILADSSNIADSLIANTDKFFTTQFNSSETNSKIISNSKLDANNTSELNYFNISSVLSNTVNNIDLFTSLLQYLRNFTETSTAEDLAAFNTSITKQHNVIVSDLFSKLVNYNRSFTNNTVTSEFNYYYVDKYLNESGSLLDTPAAFINKITSDNNSISDVSSNQVNYLRSFEDLLDATDDYYGAATVGDDEYASFNKVTVDSILHQDTTVFNIASILANSSNITDSLATNTSRFLSTQFNSSENNSKIINSSKLDASNTSELNQFNISSLVNNTVITNDLFRSLLEYLRSFTETIVPQDLIETNTSTYKQDTSNINDLFNKIVNYQPQIFDNVVFAEYILSLIGKNTLNILNITDNKLVNTSKYFTDTNITTDISNNQISYLRNFEDLVDITDDYYGVATIGDDKYAGFGKVINDSTANIDSSKFNTYVVLSDSRNLYTSDTSNNTIKPAKTETISFIDILTYYKFGGKTFTETIFSIDSGTINNQNYFASSYVVPGYAGTNTYFGT